MFRTFAWLYLAFYCAIALLGLRGSLKQRGSRLVMIGDVAMSVIAVAGLCLLLLHVESEPLRAAWKVVAPLLVVGSISLSVFEIREVERSPEPDLSQRERYWVVLVGSGLGILSMVPILLANLVYAYAPHLWPAA